MKTIKAWLLQVAIAFDRLANAVTCGSCDETLSSRAYRAHRDGRRPGKWLAPIIDQVFALFGQLEHCKASWQYEERRLTRTVTVDSAGQRLSETLRKG